MKVSVDFKLNLRSKEVTKIVTEATRLGLRDTIVAIHGDAVRKSPRKTGHNKRSIASEVSGMGLVATGGEGGSERMVDDNRLESACYSTSGYGGFLEVGTYKMAARPYFKPALDKHKTELVPNIRKYLKK
ncbi:MAG: hypothetical protein DDT41_01608 [candidate division WS2 bacterium]|nr:hypothetical protein [Candidatus Psychracetigena formicireducens]